MLAQYYIGKHRQTDGKQNVNIRSIGHFLKLLHVRTILFPFMYHASKCLKSEKKIIENLNIKQ